MRADSSRPGVLDLSYVGVEVEYVFQKLLSGSARVLVHQPGGCVELHRR
jgi:hypothetical protein